jgi:hypothetical protein
MFSLH